MPLLLLVLLLFTAVLFAKWLLCLIVFKNVVTAATSSQTFFAVLL
jgi:hypothetical protein